MIAAIPKLELVVGDATSDQQIDALLASITEAASYNARGMRDPEVRPLPLDDYSRQLMRAAVRAWIEEALVKPLKASGE